MDGVVRCALAVMWAITVIGAIVLEYVMIGSIVGPWALLGLPIAVGVGIFLIGIVWMELLD